MAKASKNPLPPNVNVIQRAVKTMTGVKPVEFRISGTRGLVLLVFPTRRATWYFHCDVGSGRKKRRRKIKIGGLDEISLANAKDLADQFRAVVRAGGDPAGEKEKARDAITFDELAKLRLENGDLRPSTRQDYSCVLNADISPILGAKFANSVTRDDVIAVLDRITKRGASRRADTAKTCISSIFSFGLDRGIVTSNPGSGLRKRHSYLPRTVVADTETIARLWNGIDSGEAAMSPVVANIIRLILLTGLRRTEIAAARKSELDLATRAPSLLISNRRSKNAIAHRVPLSPRAAAIFREAIAASSIGDFVFSSFKGVSHIDEHSVTKAMARSRQKLGISDVTVHDLRRTVGTFLARLGVPKDIRERILNHRGSGKQNLTDVVYNIYDFDVEKRAALELWSDVLDAILQSSTREIESYESRVARANGFKITSIDILKDLRNEDENNR